MLVIDFGQTVKSGVLYVAGIVLLSIIGCSSGGSGSTDERNVTNLSLGLQERPMNLACVAPGRPPSSSPVFRERVASANAPMFMVQDGLLRWFVLSRKGIVTLYGGDETFPKIGTVLDISDRVATKFREQPAEFGALGIALDPDFINNGYTYIYYIAHPGSYEARLARFTSIDGTNTEPSSEVVLLSIPLSSGIHVGGTIAFGPDGYLYIGVGDGGVASVGGTGNAQDRFSLMGKMLRINVSGKLPYEIPPDNPFADGQDGAPEVYAWGFRNPFRWSFDSSTGDLWLGDVGQGTWEEVNIVSNGGNYGWPVREGAHCWNVTSCDSSGLIDPVFEYPHQSGLNAVIGGVVYNGSALSALTGSYIFGDRYAALYNLRVDARGNLTREELLDGGGMAAFIEASDGELYVLSEASIDKLVPAEKTLPDDFPQKLSETGCFDQADPTRVDSALIPYDVIAPLWSDGAEKERYLALPDNASIHINSEDDWEFPVGSVLVKTFRLDGDLIETRLFMRHDDGEWGGYSYEWNDEQTDALLLPGAKNKQIGSRNWRFPSRSECFQCHTAAAGRVLGPETAQLNKDIVYAATGINSNQIATLASIGMFDVNPGPPTSLPALVDPFGTNRVDLRARAYLHSNCSICHRPGGTGLGPADFRYQVSGIGLGVLYAIPAHGNFGIPNAALLFPGHPENSIISLRMHTLGLERMPPLATSMVDPRGTQLIDAWIESNLGFGIGD